MSELKNELFTALAKAQGEMEGAKKGAQNPFFKNKYADLNSCFDACREALSKNGLAIVQLPSVSETGRVEVETIITHASGQSMSGKLSLRPIKDDPQAVGSAITYARRYGLVSMIGLSQEDDDSNASSHPQKTKQSPKTTQMPEKTDIPDDYNQNAYQEATGTKSGQETASNAATIDNKPPPVKTISTKQRGDLDKLRMKHEKSPEEMKAYLASLGIDSSKNIPSNKYEVICAWVSTPVKKTEPKNCPKHPKMCVDSEWRQEKEGTRCYCMFSDSPCPYPAINLKKEISDAK